MTAALQVNSDTEESVVSELRRYVRDNFSLSELSDDELFDSVSRLVIEKKGGNVSIPIFAIKSFDFGP